MASGLDKTRQILARSRNRAVLPVLAAGLRSSSAEARAAAIRATIARTDPPSHLQWIRLFAQLGEPERAMLAEAHRAMPHHAAPALKAALLKSDRLLVENVCQFILISRDFDLFPALLKAAENRRHPQAQQIASTILTLAHTLHDWFAEATADGEQAATDSVFIRRRALAALEDAVSDGAKNVPPEIIEAFLLLAPSDNPVLLRILSDPQHACHAPLVAMLSEHENSAVVERLVALLRDAAAPDAALEAIARRSDRPFVECLLRALKRPVPLRVLHNMQRLRSVAWLQSHRELLLDMDGRAQAVAVELALASNMEKAAQFDLLMLLVKEGLAEGRRAACQALARFDGPPVDLLVLTALDDPDAGVQAAAARQLRPRRIPEALKVLVEMLDASSAEVRDAARSSLAEFNFIRYRAMFDLLDENAIQSTGQLVRKVDDAAIDGLLEELSSPSVSARLRGIEMAVAMQATQEVCDQIVELAKHENVAVRKEALAALANCTGPKVLEALERAVGDANRSIAEAARQSLARIPIERSDSSCQHKPDDQPQLHRSYLPLWLLAARQDLPRVWGRFDHQRPADGTSQLLLVAGMAAIFALALLIWLRVTRGPQRHFQANSAQRMFRELARAHGLNRSARRLLKRLAAERRLASPALLFVEPKHFEATTLPAIMKPAAGDLQHLRERLFT